MGIFEKIDTSHHEQVVFCHSKELGLKAIIAIHDTTLGPALGGCRLWPYETEESAVVDVLRLSRGMTYKAAAAGLNLGGGKSVIIAKRERKSEALFRAFGRFVETLKGRYITAEDVNIDVRDMTYVHAETKHVTGIPVSMGGSGDPSPFTALGVYVGMKSSMKERTGNDSLAGKRVAVQGVGHVGRHIIDLIIRDGVTKVYVTDIRTELLKEVKQEFGDVIEIIDDPNGIYSCDVDIFCPCALGAVVNPQTIPQLKCSIIAGSANNQLQDETRDGQMLRERGILYAPDYVINAGGLINVSIELEGWDEDRSTHQVHEIYGILQGIYRRARENDVPTNVAADRYAEERLGHARVINSIRVDMPQR